MQGCQSVAQARAFHGSLFPVFAPRLRERDRQFTKNQYKKRNVNTGVGAPTPRTNTAESAERDCLTKAAAAEYRKSGGKVDERGTVYYPGIGSLMGCCAGAAKAPPSLLLPPSETESLTAVDARRMHQPGSRRFVKSENALLRFYATPALRIVRNET